MKVAIFYPPGGSGKLLLSIVEILLGNNLIQSPTSFGSMHQSGRWKYKKVKKINNVNVPITNNDLPNTLTQPVITIGHLSSREVISIMSLIEDFKILYIYTTNISDCITMSNRNMYKHVEAEFDEISPMQKALLSSKITKPPKHFKDIPDKVVEQNVVGGALKNFRHRPIKINAKNILQLNYATLLKNTDTVDKICKFLNLYTNIEQAKKIYSEYITVQDDCPEYVTINSIKKYYNKRR